MAIMLAVFGPRATTSPGRTRSDGIVTRFPLTETRPWLTNWRAWGRVRAQPLR